MNFNTVCCYLVSQEINPLEDLFQWQLGLNGGMSLLLQCGDRKFYIYFGVY